MFLLWFVKFTIITQISEEANNSEVTHMMFLSHIKHPSCVCVCCKGREPEFCYRLIPLQGDEVYKMKAQ